jgi:rubrerythrin
MSNKLTNEIFIQRAKEVHNDKYDYSNIKYVDYHTPVLINCFKHGLFLQSPAEHLNGKGCKKCGYETVSKSLKSNAENFIEKAKNIHGDKYDYSLVDYKNSKTKVKIICKKCGNIFEQMPDKHLKRNGCPNCSKYKKTNTAFFIEKAKNIHGDKYDYSLVDYKNSKTKVKIICKKCGNVFEQKPNVHIQGSGCPNCRFMNPKNEAIIFDWLKLNNYLFERNKKFKDLKDKKLLSYDFYIPSKKLLIEYNGEQHYKKINCFGGRKKLLIQKHHDWMKRKYAQKNGYSLLVIPYWEKDNMKKILLETLS